MAFKFFNIGKANAEIEAAESAINPALAKANILSIHVDGKPVPAAEATLAARIAALLAVNPPGEGQQNVNELMVTNAELAKQLEKLTGDHAAAMATIGGLQRENQALETRATTAESAVNTLTAEKQSLSVQLSASNSEFSRVNQQLTAHNTELSKICLANGCLELTGPDGKPLAADATPEQRLKAAEAIPFAEKLKAYQGAVNAAMARTGLSANSLPAAGGSSSTANLATRGIVAQYHSITDPKAKNEFFKKNKDALREAAFGN